MQVLVAAQRGAVGHDLYRGWVVTGLIRTPPNRILGGSTVPLLLGKWEASIGCFAGSLYSVRIVLPLKLTGHFSSSKITLHPALQRMCMPSKDAIFISRTMCPINLCGRPGMSTSHMCVDTIFFPLGRLICIGFVATQMFLAGGPAITNTDVAPVLGTACVDVISIAFTWCSPEVVQFDAMIVISLLLSAQCVEARHN
jgi:hypothetical protein